MKKQFSMDQFLDNDRSYQSTFQILHFFIAQQIVIEIEIVLSGVLLSSLTIFMTLGSTYGVLLIQIGGLSLSWRQFLVRCVDPIYQGIFSYVKVTRFPLDLVEIDWRHVYTLEIIKSLVIFVILLRFNTLVDSSFRFLSGLLLSWTQFSL